MTISETIQRRIENHPENVELSAQEQTSLETELEELIRVIADKPNYSAAAADLDALGRLQGLLALLLFRYAAPLSARQRQLVRQFDRADDPDARAFIFRQICQGRL